MAVHPSSPFDDDPEGVRRRYRSASVQDVDAIHQILRESNLSIPHPYDRERLTQAPIGQILAALCECAGAVVGVLQWRNLGDELEILDLAVCKPHRRSGHAAFLLENFLREASLGAAKKVFLEVRESNLPAIALYKKFGFTVSGRRSNYYRNPPEAALLMRRVLTPAAQG